MFASWQKDIMNYKNENWILKERKLKVERMRIIYYNNENWDLQEMYKESKSRHGSIAATITKTAFYLVFRSGYTTFAA